MAKRSKKSSLEASLLRHRALSKVRKTSNHANSQIVKRPSKKIEKNRQHQIEASKKFIPFGKEDVVLLVGEGDFSFALSVVKQGYITNPKNLIATSYDQSSREAELKYPHTFKEIYEELQTLGVKLLFGIDATNLPKSLKKELSSIPPIDYIMFNFPHTGRGMKDLDRNIRDHQLLVVNYFKSSLSLFQGQNNFKPKTHDESLNIQQRSSSPPKIIISVFEGEPYDSWMIKSLGKSLGLKVERSGAFDWKSFPEYSHKRTNSEQQTTKHFKERDARIYIFEKYSSNTGSKKHKKDDSSDDE